MALKGPLLLDPHNVIFYKIDHLGDPVVRRNRIVLGVQMCMKGLRATAKEGQVIVSIGGRSAGRRFKRSRVLRDQLVWVGIVVKVHAKKAPDRRPLVECVGVFFRKGLPGWRDAWPALGKWVDEVGQMHRVRSIPKEQRTALVELAAWALKSDLARNARVGRWKSVRSLIES